MARSKRAAKAKARQQTQSLIHAQTRHDISRIKGLSSGTSYAYSIGAPRFTNGGILMPSDVLARHETPGPDDAPHMEDYHGQARSSLAPFVETPADSNNASLSSCSPSEDEIIFVGKDPKARLAALEESIDSDWSIGQQKRKKKSRLNKPISSTANRDINGTSVPSKDDSIQHTPASGDALPKMREVVTLPIHESQPQNVLSIQQAIPLQIQGLAGVAFIDVEGSKLPQSLQTSKSSVLATSPVHQIQSTEIVTRASCITIHDEKDVEMVDDEDGEDDRDEDEEDDRDEDDESVDDDDEDDEEAILRDYVQNILAGSDTDGSAGSATRSSFRLRELDMMTEPGKLQRIGRGSKKSDASRAFKDTKSANAQGSNRSDLAPTHRVRNLRTNGYEPHTFNFAITASSSEAGDDDEDVDNDEIIAKMLAEEAWVDVDPTEEFDVMDFERPSLQKRKKKGKLAAVPQISDEELQEKLNNAWENDRSKKRDRKIQREELRKQGLLRRRNAKYVADDSSDADHEEDESNLKEKYETGMLKEDLWKELLAFCTSDRTILSLPPFDANIRRLIHTIISKIGLKSKSHGKGIQRYLVITKSNRQFRLDQKTFNKCKKFIKSNFLYRQDVGSPPLTVHVPRVSRANRATGGGVSNSGGGSRVAAVKAGDRIGEGAPELHDAKGSAKARAMMEKMGWSAGQSLGKEENKGILNPVEQVVWYRKAGLG